MTALVGLSVADATDASTLWLTELEATIEQRDESGSDWLPAATTADCSLDTDLPLELSATADGGLEAEVELRCAPGSLAPGAEIRLRLEGRDSSGLELRPLTQSKKL